MSDVDSSGNRTFHFDEGVLSLPFGFKDRSTQVLEWTVDNTDSVLLIILRDRWPDPQGTRTSDSFPAYVARETKDYAARFLGFKLESAEYADPFDGALPLLRCVFRWKSERGVLYHHQAFVLSEPLVLVLTVTANVAHRERADQIMQTALAGLRFRED